MALMFFWGAGLGVGKADAIVDVVGMERVADCDFAEKVVAK